MPHNLTKTYNELLELFSMPPGEQLKSLKGVFNRDFVNSVPPSFYGRVVRPTTADGEDTMERLFRHLTTVMADKATRHREFDMVRSLRLHWVRHHLDQRTPENIFVFSVQEREGVRTYIYDNVERYVVILEPLRDGTGYYLLTAYPLAGKDNVRDKIMKKYERRLGNVI